MTGAAERAAVIAAARRSVAVGLTHGLSGNVSLRVAAGMAITPSGIDYAELEPADVVVMGLDGTIAPDARRTPSSEWRMHAAIYRDRPELAAIVHGHSPAATAVACLGRGLPAFHYMIAVAGGDDVRCAGYAPFGSEELARLAVAALRDRRACLLARHGLIAAGADLAEALRVGSEVEYLADLYLRLLPLGEPTPLTSEEMAEVLRRFRDYRPRGPRAGG